MFSYLSLPSPPDVISYKERRIRGPITGGNRGLSKAAMDAELFGAVKATFSLLFPSLVGVEMLLALFETWVGYSCLMISGTLVVAPLI